MRLYITDDVVVSWLVVVSLGDALGPNLIIVSGGHIMRSSKVLFQCSRDTSLP